MDLNLYFMVMAVYGPKLRPDDQMGHGSQSLSQGSRASPPAQRLSSIGKEGI